MLLSRLATRTLVKREILPRLSTTIVTRSNVFIKPTIRQFKSSVKVNEEELTKAVKVS
jgi:hypothetical protein